MALPGCAGEGVESRGSTGEPRTPSPAIAGEVAPKATEGAALEPALEPYPLNPFATKYDSALPDRDAGGLACSVVLKCRFSM